ncbi:MAG: hypothetical protein ACR2NO_00795 [Chloroflexota bacterium]
MAEVGRAPLATAAERAAAAAPRPFSRPRTFLRVGAGLLGIFVFVFALEVIKSGARGLVPVLEQFDVSGAANATGFGWLFAYVVLSGSPVAAIGVSLLAGGAFSESEAFAVIAGSRLGASFIVLAVGFVYFLARRRNADGLYIGVVALLTTFTTQGPALLLGLVSLHYGWLEGVSISTPASLLDLTDAVYGRWVTLLNDMLPRGLVFAAGVGILLASFAIFDRALPQLEGEAQGIARALHFLNRRPLMFLLGAAVTLTTLSVAISITVLVPLSLKGYLKREHIIPYIMGANITTFIDTLFASVLLGGHTAFVVVLTEMASVAAVSLVLLTLLYRPYAATILRAAGWTTARPRHLAIFLAAIVAAPAFLLLP